MNYTFIGKDLIGGHMYKDFTFGNVYEIKRKQLPEVYRSTEFFWTIDDTGKNIMVSNNAKRKYFIKLE